MKKLELIILNNLLTNEDYLRKVVPFLKDEYFHDWAEKKVFKAIANFVEIYNAPPSVEALTIVLQQDKGMTDDEYEKITSVIDNFNTEPLSNKEWLLNETEKFCKDKAVYNAIVHSIQIIDGKDQTHTQEAIPDILQNALGVCFDSSVGHDYIIDSDNRFDFYHRDEEKLPFDLDMFNKITKGGLPNKTLNIALAGTGVGKSLFMCHMASGCLSQGKNVLYITMEMSEERIAERIDANLMNVAMDDLKTLPKQMFDDRITKIKNKTEGKLIIKEYPTAAAHAGHFRALLNELKLKKEFVPQIIFIDYLNICASSRFKVSGQVNSYTYIKGIAEELRGLAVEFDVPIVSATQTTRSGFCLDLETEVITPRGKKLLKDVLPGDLLFSNEGWNEVKTVFEKTKKKMFKITTENGKEIICSEDHLFPTETGEKSIRNGLCVEDKLLINKSDV